MSPYTFFTLMCLLFGTVSTWYGCSVEGKLIFEHRVKYDSIPDTSGVAMPDFEIPKGVKVCELKLEARGVYLKGNQKFDGFMSAEIYDDAEKESCQFGGDIYYDFGVSDGESWTENVRSVNKYFKVDTAGRFSADLFFERGNGLKELGTNIPVPINGAEIVFQVRTGEGEAGNLMMVWGIIFLVIGCIMLFGLDEFA